MLFAPPQTPEEIAAAAREERERRERERAERLPIVVGLLCTVFFHLMTLGLMIWMPPFLFHEPVLSAEEEARLKRGQQEVLLNLVDETPPEQPVPSRFVETNPDAPENDPGKTNNFGARNQQAAQPEPGKDHSDRPKTSGPIENSTAIVTGNRVTPLEVPMPGANGENQPDLTATAAGPKVKTNAQTPLPGLEKITGDNPEGIGSNLGDNPKDAKAEVEKKVEGDKDKKETDKEEPQVAVNGGTMGGRPGPPGRPGPRPRPRLQQVRPAVLANQPMSASNAGVIAVDSKMSEYGEYLQELIDTVDAQWQKLVFDMASHPPRSTVSVTFKLNSKGEVSEIVDVQENAGKQGTYACLDAIRARAPYRPWSKAMIAVLGEEQEIRFTFYYW